MTEQQPIAEKDAPVSEADVWPVHRALGDWMWKDADAPRLSRDTQWRIAEWIVRRERESTTRVLEPPPAMPSPLPDPVVPDVRETPPPTGGSDA